MRDGGRSAYEHRYLAPVLCEHVRLEGTLLCRCLVPVDDLMPQAIL